MHPYVEQLLRWRRDDPARKLGGLVLEVKGDFCGQVRSILSGAGRTDVRRQLDLPLSDNYSCRSVLGEGDHLAGW
jgi:hypothetical protein